MSISFYPATVDGAVTRPLLRCACDAIEALIRPPLRVQCAACVATLNCNTRNAHDLLVYLGLDVSPTFDTGGHIEATKLIELCERRLAMDDVEAALPAVQHSARYFEGGRAASYLRAHCKELLVIATLARGFRVAWS